MSIYVYLCLSISVYIYLYLSISIYIYLYLLLNFTSSWDFAIFREYWISKSRCNIWCSVRAQGWHQKLKRHGLHGFALDQPSINWIGPINRSEKMKRSEIVGNGRETWSGQNLFNQHFFVNKHFRATPCFFFEGPKVSKGKRLEPVGDRTFARQKSSCFVAYVHELDDGWPESDKRRFSSSSEYGSRKK